MNFIHITSLNLGLVPCGTPLMPLAIGRTRRVRRLMSCYADDLRLWSATFLGLAFRLLAFNCLILLLSPLGLEPRTP